MADNKVVIQEILSEKNEKQKKELYNKYVNQNTPRHKWSTNLLRAFVSGGIVCTIGQVLTSVYMYFGLDKDAAGLFMILTLMLISILLTGFGIFARIAKFSGAGVLVPITGFANSVASPAIEFKKEGQVFGIGCKIFTIAGPVILYGIFTSWVLGLVYWIGKMQCF